MLLHCISKCCELLSENVECTTNYIIRGEDSSGFDSEHKLLITLTHLDCSLESLRLSEPDTFYAQYTFVSILDLDRVPHLVELVDVARACPHKLLLLLDREVIVDLVIDPDSGFLAHLTGGDGRPLGVSLASPLLGDEIHIQLLVLAELHDQNGILVLALIVEVHDRHH